VWQLCPIRNRPAVNHCCAVIVLNLVARYQLPDGSRSDLCACFVESLKQTSFSGSTQCSLKRKRIAISRDSILRSPISCVLTKLTQPPVNSLSDGRRTRGISCTAGRLCTTKSVKSHRPSVYSTICELLGGKFKLQARVVSPENPVLYCCVLEHSRGSPHSSLGSWLSLGLLRFRR